MLLQKYEPPILACAVNEVLASLARENSSNMPTLIIPYFVAASKLKLESKNSTTNDEVSLFGMQIGPETDVTQALVSRAQKLPSSLQIHDEPVACILQLVRVLKMPAFVLTGKSGQSLPHKTFGEEVEVLFQIFSPFSYFAKEKTSPAKSHGISHPETHNYDISFIVLNIIPWFFCCSFSDASRRGDQCNLPKNAKEIKLEL